MQQAFPWDALIKESIGGAVALFALLLVLRYKPWRNGIRHIQSPEQTAGERSVDFWRHEHRLSVRAGVEDAFRERNEMLRRMIREETLDVLKSDEFKRALVFAMRYFYGLGKDKSTGE